MVFSIKPGIPGIATCRFRWLQIAACAVLAWGCLQGGPARMLPLGPSAPPLTEEAAAGTTAPEVANGASTLSATGQSSAPQQLESASFGLSTVEVIVNRNDTLDRIFRRLKLSLADLASLRSLPGLKARLDSLRPGESLRLSHRDGALFGLERSMHKAFLRAPVEFTRISSRFNSARLHPILHHIRAHKGVDYAAPIGTPVRAAGDGRIRFAGLKGGYGNVVEIEHTRSIVTVYGHLSRFARATRVGQHVAQGTVIAYVGMTGLATGPHLHYEYRVNGVFRNPQTVPLPEAEPLDARWHSDFLARSAPLLASLEEPLGPALVARCYKVGC